MKKSSILAGILVMILAAIATYSNHFHNEFHFDDSHAIQDNVFIRDIKNIPLFFKDGSTSSVLPQNQAYRPLVVASLAFDYWLGKGYNLFYFHLSTFIIFVLMGVMLFYFFKEIYQRSSILSRPQIVYTALTAAAWYLLHPANAETVNYIIARNDVQSTFFVVLAFILYIFSPFCRKAYLYLLAVIIGAFAKPPTIMFAPIFLCYLLLFEEKLSLTDLFKKDNLSRVFAVLKKAIPAFAVCAFMYVFLDKMTPKTWEPGGTKPLQYLITQPFVILHYFAMFFSPTELSADTDWTLLPSVLDIRFFAGTLFVLVMIGIAFLTSKKEVLRPVSFGILWFFLALVPTSSIIPLGEVLNDHRMFFPFIGLALAVSYSVALLLLQLKSSLKMSNSGFLYLTVFFVIVGLSGYAYGTHERNKVWRTEESLWYDVTLKSPKNGRGLMNYGLAKMAKGDYATAEEYYRRAMEFVPNYGILYVNMGVVKEALGDKVAAEENYRKALVLGPRFPDTHYFLGKFLFNQNRYAEAEAELNKTLELSSSHLLAHLLLLHIYETEENWEKLEALAKNTLSVLPENTDALYYLKAAQQKQSKLDIEAEALKKSPDATKYLNLSLAYYNAGRYEKCIEAAKAAVKLKPDFAEAYNNMGSAYNLLKKYNKAEMALKKALAIRPDFQLAKNNLALAQSNLRSSAIAEADSKMKPEDYINLSLTYFNQGKYKECIDACQSALKLKPDYDLAYNNICAAYNELKQWDKAIDLGEKGLTVNPGNQLLRNNLQVSYQGKKGK